MTNPFMPKHSNKENQAYFSNPFEDGYRTNVKANALQSFSNFSTASQCKNSSILSSMNSECGKLSRGRTMQSQQLGSKYFQESAQISYQNPFEKKSAKSTAVKEEISHEYIPPDYRNNEEYKVILCRKLLKHPKHKTNKTFQKADFIHLDRDQLINKDYSLLTKRRKISNVKKIYSGQFELKNHQNASHFFKLYRDEDVGVDENWQEFIIETNIDEDVLTEEEMLEKLNNVVYNDLLEGINDLKDGMKNPEELLSNYCGKN